MSCIENATQSFMQAAGQLKDIGFPDNFFDDERMLRRSLLAEEYNEYVLAESNNDLVEVCDGLADIIVVAVGSLYKYVGRVVAEEILNEVSSSNLSKVVDGKVIKNAEGKVMKPAGYFKPDIQRILKARLDG